MQFAADGFLGGQLVIAIAFGLDQLSAHLGGSQACEQATTAKGRIGLCLCVDDVADVAQQVGQVMFAASSSTRREVVRSGDDAVEFEKCLADGDTIPAEFTLGRALSTWAKNANRASHEPAPINAAKFLGGRDQQISGCVVEFHCFRHRSLGELHCTG